MTAAMNALDPAGPEAAAIHGLWLLLLAVCTAMYVLVLLFLWLALRRRQAASASAERPLTWLGYGWTGLILIGLFGLTVASWAADRHLVAPAENPLSIRVTGHQWWWRVEYLDPEPSRRFETANEIHVPAGRPVLLELRANDVIHSFWVPNIQGKQDLIPGRVNQLRFTPERTGIFRGQCAEFCGLQHAHMALLLTVEEPEAFEAWQAAQLAPAAEPSDPVAAAGRQNFLSGPCALCHAIRGTTAASRAGPDLTHLASRSTLAAGALPFGRGPLAAWLSDPQGVKPGNHMPATGLSPPELDGLLAYLGGLR